MIKRQFQKHQRFLSALDNTRHPLFDDSEPLSVAEMLRRSLNGIPLSVPKPKENLPLNGNFFSDKFDIIDTAIRNDMRLSKEKKEQLAAERKKRIEEVTAFRKWQEEQQRQQMLGPGAGSNAGDASGAQ